MKRMEMFVTVTGVSGSVSTYAGEVKFVNVETNNGLAFTASRGEAPQVGDRLLVAIEAADAPDQLPFDAGVGRQAENVGTGGSL